MRGAASKNAGNRVARARESARDAGWLADAAGGRDSTGLSMLLVRSFDAGGRGGGSFDAVAAYRRPVDTRALIDKIHES
jgi:hypothetical protein